MNLKRYLPEDRSIYILWSILVVSFILRCWHLTFQSYWLDELHTMNEADPNISWSALFSYLKCCDQHPPLYFILCRFCFAIFGHTELVGRFISLLFGTAGVWAMWLLGKEFLDRRLGLIAAALTGFNYFHIVYSQEARNYIVVFFFAVLSFVYFVRLLKQLKNKNAILYAVFTLLMMYTHYYGLFVAVSQFFTALLFIVLDRNNRNLLFSKFLLAGIIIAICYLPWIPFVLAMSDIHSFWIGAIANNFAKEFFSQYFGDNALILPFIILLLIYYCLEVFRSGRPLMHTSPIKQNDPLSLSFIILFTTTVLTYLIPYLRSVLVVPMLFNRYTIVVVPAFIIAISFALIQIHHATVRGLLLGTILLLSVIDLIVIKKYYKQISKTQFREVTSFVANQPANTYPIINQRTSWQDQYYLNRYHYKGEVLTGKKEDMVDSILGKKSKKFDLQAFWIVGFHGEAKLAADKRAALDTAFTLMKDTSGYDAWAELYVSKWAANGSQVITSTNFPEPNAADIDGQKVIAIWGGTVKSYAVTFKKGSYEMSVLSKGTPVAGVYPHLNIYMNGKKVYEFYTPQVFGTRKTIISVPADGNYEIQIELDNDASDPAKSEDRNAFIQRILFMKQ